MIDHRIQMSDLLKSDEIHSASPTYTILAIIAAIYISERLAWYFFIYTFFLKFNNNTHNRNRPNIPFVCIARRTRSLNETFIILYVYIYYINHQYVSVINHNGIMMFLKIASQKYYCSWLWNKLDIFI